MKNLLTILAISLCLVLTATSGEEKANATETVDSFLLEIELLKQEIQLTQRKINILERLRSHYIKNNLTVPQINPEILHQTVNYASSPVDYGTPYSHHPTYGNIPSQSVTETRKGNDYAFLNLLLKRFTLNFNKPLKDIQYLATKNFQRTNDDTPSSHIIVFLTDDNMLHLYDSNGGYITNYTVGHGVLKMSVSTFTDEYFILTVGNDNTLRYHRVDLIKLKIESETNETKKSSKPKYTQSYAVTLEYVFDLVTKQIPKEGEYTPSVLNDAPISLSSVVVKSIKFITISDSEGVMHFIYRNGTYKGSDKHPDGPVKGIHKYYPNPMVYSDKSIGFYNPLALQTVAPHCDLPGENILNVEVDQYSASSFYVLVDTGDVLFYDFKQNNPQCKIMAKRVGLVQGQLDGVSLHASKGFIMIQESSKSLNLVAYNITDLPYTGQIESEYFNVSFYPHRDSQDHVVKSKYVVQRNTFQTTFIGAYYQFENNTCTFTTYEFTTPIRSNSDWLANLRFPIVIVAIVLVIGYQFYNRKQKKEKDEMDKLEKLTRNKFDEFTGGKGGKGSKNRDISSLKEELDSLTRQTKMMESQLGGVAKSAGKSKRVNFGNDDDDGLGDISTDKKYD